MSSISFYKHLDKNASTEEKKVAVQTWKNQAIATFLSVSLGFSIFLIQDGLKEENSRKTLKGSLIEELTMIKEQLTQFAPNTETGAISINSIVLLPSKTISRSIESNLFEQKIVRHLLLLESFISEHNRWADYAVDSLKDVSNPGTLKRFELINNFSIIDEQILTKTKYALDCINTGVSALDPDCN